MMSQNRQQDIDRKAAENDFQVNIKAELEIELLHHKIDQLREEEVLSLTKAVSELTALLRNAKLAGSHRNYVSTLDPHEQAAGLEGWSKRVARRASDIRGRSSHFRGAQPGQLRWRIPDSRDGPFTSSTAPATGARASAGGAGLLARSNRTSERLIGWRLPAQ